MMQRLLTIILLISIGTSSANGGWCQIYAEFGPGAEQKDLAGEDCCVLSESDSGEESTMHCHKAVDETMACICDIPQSSNPANSPVAGIQLITLLPSENVQHSFSISPISKSNSYTSANYYLQSNKTYLENSCLRI